jgi:PAS domain S-box-containing protein
MTNGLTNPHPDPTTAHGDRGVAGRPLIPLDAVALPLGAVGLVTGDLVALVDAEGLLLTVSTAWEEMLGVASTEILGRAWPDLLRPEDAQAARAALARVVGGRNVQATRGLLRAPDGSLRWLVWRIVRALPGTYLVGGRDVTRRTKRSARLAESQDLFEHFAQRVRDVFWVTEPGADALRYVSASYEAVFGRRREDLYLAPQQWAEAIHPEDRSRVLVASREHEEEGTYDETYRIVRPDGSVRWIRDRAFPVRDDRGRVVRIFGLAEDLTAQRGAEEALRKTEQRLSQSQRLEAVGRLAGGIAHDFNNLLTVIVGYAAVLEDRFGKDAVARHLVSTIRRTGERAGGLTRQLLAFSRSQLMKPVVLDLGHLVNEMTPLLRRLVEENVELHFDVAEDRGMVLADPGQMGQVLLNLVANARDAMPAGGIATIRVANAVVDEDEARSRPDARPGPHVALSVSDTGVGMDAATRDRVFEPFFTTKPAGKGTGLGLATVLGVVTQSGGHVDVESEPGKGTTVRVRLPRVSGAEAPAAPVAPPGVVSGTERVLVVEDEKDVRDLAISVLTARGYRARGVSTGAEALVELRDAPGYDLVLTDVVMPGISGRELHEKAREAGSRARFLFMSGYTDDAVLRQGVVAERVSFLEKPFSVEDLLRRVRSVLDAPVS